MQNDGVLTATYDMGKGIKSLNEPLYGNVDDGRYHVARFRRYGANATLQLDHHPPRSISPQGTGSTYASPCTSYCDLFTSNLMLVILLLIEPVTISVQL